MTRQRTKSSLGFACVITISMLGCGGTSNRAGSGAGAGLGKTPVPGAIASKDPMIIDPSAVSGPPVSSPAPAQLLAKVVIPTPGVAIQSLGRMVDVFKPGAAQMMTPQVLP